MLLYVYVLSKKKLVCRLYPTSPNLLGVRKYINSSATLTATSSFGVGVLLYVIKKKKSNKIKKM